MIEVRRDEDGELCGYVAAGADGWRALAALLPRLRGWDLVVLGADRGLERLLPRRPERALEVRVGGVACRLLHYRP